MGIRDRPTAPRSPWQNGHTERLIGSIRRECLDHVLVLSEAHLRRILRACADYYNRTCTHLALGKDAPLGRPVQVAGSLTAPSRWTPSRIRPDGLNGRHRCDAWLAFQLCHLTPRLTSQKTIDEAVLLADVGVQWL